MTSPWANFFAAIDRGAAEDAERVLDEMRHAASDSTGQLLLDVRISIPENGDRVRFDVLKDASSGSISASLPLTELRPAADDDDAYIGVLDSFAYALAAECCGQAGRPRREERFGDTLPPRHDLDGYRRIAYHAQIEGRLGGLDDILLHGEVGTGKTMTALAQADSWANEGGGLIWLDLTNPHDCDESVAYALLTMRHRQKILVVIDNVQASVSSARGVFSLVRRLRTDLRLQIVVLATGSSAVAKVTPPLATVEPILIHTQGHNVVSAILNGSDGLTRQHQDQIRTLADGNAFVARIAIDLLHVHGRVPGDDEFAELAAEQLRVDTVPPAAQLLLYKLACLSLVEIEARRRCSLLVGAQSALKELVEANLVHLNDESYTVGHRSLAKLLVRHGHRAWRYNGQLPSPDRVAFDYLQRADDAQIKATLEWLDLLPFAGENPHSDAKRLANAWGALESLGNLLARRVRDDPTCGDEVTSAAFAAIAFVHLDRREAWERTAEFIRDRVIYDSDTELPRWIGAPPADLEAFIRIQQLIEAERRAVEANLPGAEPDTPPFDPEIACRAWLLGVLLSFEAKALDYQRERVTRLRRIAESHIDGGAFELRIVPWITAQIVIGLCDAGQDFSSNEVVRGACRWLLLDANYGGAYEAGWSNGVTGSTSDTDDTLTTALCLKALLEADIRDLRSNEKFRTGYKSLCAAQERLEPEGQETERALIVEARLSNGDQWEDLLPAILKLLQWAIDENQGHDVKATGSGDPLSASAKAPFIAVCLRTIIWTTVTSELRRLLKELWNLDDLLSGSNGSRPAGDGARADDTTPSDPAPASPARIPPPTKISRAIDRLRGQIQQEIDGRARLLDRLTEKSSEPIVSQMRAYKEWLARLTRLEARLAANPPTAADIAELNELGEAVFKASWDEIQFEE
jgi:hypothetical protein